MRAPTKQEIKEPQDTYFEKKESQKFTPANKPASPVYNFFSQINNQELSPYQESLPEELHKLKDVPLPKQLTKISPNCAPEVATTKANNRPVKLDLATHLNN